MFSFRACLPGRLLSTDITGAVAIRFGLVMLLAIVQPMARGDEPEDLSPPQAGSDAAARMVIQYAIDRAAAQPGSRQAAERSARQPLPAPQVDEPEGLVMARISAEVAARQLEAKRLAQKSPGDALALLDNVAAGLDKQPLPDETRDRLLRRIERTRQYIEEATGKRRAELALEKQNEAIEAEIDGKRQRRVEVDQRIAMLVD